MTLGQRLEGDRGVNYEDIWRKSIPDRDQFLQMLLGRNVSGVFKE